MKVTKETVTISELKRWARRGPKGQTVQLKDADPNELQIFIDNMLATIKGKSVKYGFLIKRRVRLNLLYVRKLETGSSSL